MKVLFITSSYPSSSKDNGGIFLKHLAENLAQFDCEITILTPHVSGLKFSESVNNIKIVRFPYFFPFSYQKMKRAGGIPNLIEKHSFTLLQFPLFILFEFFYTFKLCKKTNFDIVHTHWLFPQGFIGFVIRRVFNIKHVCSLHGSDIYLVNRHLLLRLAARVFYSSSDYIVPNSSDTYNLFNTIMKKKGQNTEIIPMGVDTKKFHPNNLGINIKKNEDHFQILCISSLIKRKGIEYLIIAMMKITQKYPKLKLVIIGEGSEKNKLIELIKEFNLKDNIELLQNLDEATLLKYYISSDIFILPSIHYQGFSEGLGVVLIEAMACGIPVIGTKIGGITDIIEDNANGFLISEKSPDDIANRVLLILSNPELKEKFSINGRKTVNTKFSWQIIANQYYLLYLKATLQSKRK